LISFFCFQKSYYSSWQATADEYMGQNGGVLALAVFAGASYRGRQYAEPGHADDRKSRRGQNDTSVFWNNFSY
jgi:hypothetical protein